MVFGSFFDPESADEHGLVALGGDLRPERLLYAYRRGVFPWYDEGYPICWWSPDPRAIFELDGLHVSRRLRRTVCSGRFTVTINHDFAAVIRGCADRPDSGTWIMPEMITAYERLHHLGHAHSVEVWRACELVGGLYGVAVGGLFAGESMFSRQSDASKVALVFLVERLRQRGFQLFDIQFLTAHTARLGAIEIPRADYLRRLKSALQCPVTFI
ncbi:MAG: leucyl/phenylalanyl-tRNA--protein transferase [Gemmataceae bacterium]